MFLSSIILFFAIFNIGSYHVNGEGTQKFQYLPAGQCSMTNKDCSKLDNNYVTIDGKLDKLLSSISQKNGEAGEHQKKSEETLKQLEDLILEKDAKLKTCQQPLPMPNGATGCEDKYRQYGNYCWRYCEANGPKWCYTKQKCKDGNDCTYQKECPGIACSDDPNCVVKC